MIENILNIIKKDGKKINPRAFALSDQIFFAQRLSLLLNSGISTVESLSIMKNMDSSIKRKAVYGLMIENIERGLSLSRVIRNEKIKFNNFLIMLIQNSELSGNLADALLQACAFLEKKNKMKKKIISSLIYPFFIVVFTILMTLFLILYIFPKIIPLLKSLNITLPVMTRIVQGLYYFLISYGFWVFIFIAVLFSFLYVLIHKIQKLKYKMHAFYISIPFLNKYIKTYSIYPICSMAEMLLSSGRSLADIMNMSKEYSANLVYKRVFFDIHEELLKGVSLSVSIRNNSRYFPPLLPHMCEIGERTGNLAYMLKNCSSIFESDIDDILKRFTSLIEPTLMIFMGLLVGSIALSIILPVYEITNHLGK